MEPLTCVRIKDTHPSDILKGKIGNLVQRMTINGDDMPIPVYVWWISVPVGHGLMSHPIVEEEFIELFEPICGTGGSVSSRRTPGSVTEANLLAELELGDGAL